MTARPAFAALQVKPHADQQYYWCAVCEEMYIAHRDHLSAECCCREHRDALETFAEREDMSMSQAEREYPFYKHEDFTESE